MKIGDTFKNSCGVTYKVIGENASGLISTRIFEDTPMKKEITNEEVIEELKEEFEVDESHKYTRTEVKRLTVPKLEELCRELGLPINTGTQMKASIIDKLSL